MNIFILLFIFLKTRFFIVLVLFINVLFKAKALNTLIREKWVRMTETVLGGTITFLAKIGVYDVVLPFLLVFALMFAFLEKTKVLGVEVIKDASGNEHIYTRKNMNAVVAFTAAFFVIASSQLVRIISEVMANTIILIVAGVSFLLAIGVTHTGEGEFDLATMGNGQWKKWFWVANLVGILLIFFNALGWLHDIYAFVSNNWNNSAVITVVLIALFAGMIIWLTGSPRAKSAEEESKD